MSQVNKDNVEEILPLLPGQEAFFPTLDAGGASADLEQAVWTLAGRSDPERWARALPHLEARHPILRTVFFKARKQPVQLVLKSHPIPWAVVDLRALDGADRDAALRRFPDAERRRAMAAIAGPFLRVALLRLDAEDSRLVFTWHPILLDRHSLRLLAADLRAVDDALSAGRTPPAADLSPAKEFLVWRKRQAAEEVLDFWAFQLEDFEKPTPLPHDREPAPEARRDPASWQGALSAEASLRLQALARAGGVGASTLAQAAWALVLARFSGEQDVVFGVTVDGRQVDLSGIEGMIGPIANTVPARVRIDERMPLDELLHSLEQQSLNFRYTSWVSPAQIAARSRIEPPIRLWESVVTWDQAPEPAISQPGLRGATLAVDVRPGAPWQIALTYRREVLDPLTVESLGTSLACLLESMVGPDLRLSELGMLPPPQHQRLLAELDRRAEAAAEPLAVDRFTAAARAHPDAMALTCGDQWLSYGELAARSDRLARWLRARGVGREARLGIFGERGAGMMVTILGALKAGAAWVPLDPAHPDDRLARILPTSGVAALATQGELAPRLARLTAELTPAPAITCWDGDAAPDPGDRAGAEHANGPDDLAYVFYTSGSTGQPKGAMVTHRGMANHLQAKVELLGLEASSVVVQNASHCFDVFVWQLLAPLLVGGRVVVYAGETALDPALLLARLARDGVTVLELVPSQLDALLERLAELAAAGEPPRLEALVYLLSTGEALPVPLARRWFEFFPGVPIVNAFGPTECSDDTMHHLLAAAPPATASRVPVGRAVPGFAVYVLDRRLRLLPRGCPGQLAMAGVGVGRGYLEASAATAAAFVPDPFAREAGGRLYLSGDLGRLKHDGVLEFLGRIDSQVKVRGQRIELGEVEAALARHPAVRQVAAVVRSDGGNRRLVAYFVGEARPDTAELRAFLADALPPAMVPEQCVRLDAMPVNRSGKIDRKALPAPPAIDSAASGDFVAPRDAIEAAIAEIWQQALEVPEVSVRDNFFELGGHSLLAAQVRSRISHHLDVDLPLRLVLENPELEALAREVRALVEGGRGDGGEREGIPILPAAEHYPLSHAQRLLWFQQRLDPADSSFNMPEIFLLEGTLDPEVLRRSLEALIDRHPSYRTTFTVVDGEPVQHIAPAAADVIELVDVSELAGDEQEARVRALQQEEIHAPFDLEKTPWRGRLFKLAEDRHLLLIVVHHLATDLVSFDLMIRDLEIFLRAFVAGENPSLPPLPIRYVDYAAWQRERIARGELAAAEQYWLRQLAGELPVLELPDRRRRPPQEPTHRSNVVLAPVDAAVAKRLRQLGREHGTTFFTVLLAAANAFLARITGQTDVLHGTPAANRGHVDVEAVVGFFVNMLALRTDLEGDPSFEEILERTRQTAVDGFTHEEYPFELLVRKLNPHRELGRFPIFSTAFVLMDVPADSPTPISQDLVLRPHRRADEWRTAYDFNLIFLEHEQGLEGAIIYQEDAFERPAVERLVRRFVRLVAGIAADPRQRLSALPLLTDQELGQLRLRPLPPRELYPLSLPQQDIWFQCQIMPETTVYNCCLQVDLRGRLESAALKAAVRAVVDRQAIMRARFTVADGRPVQRVGPKVDIRWIDADFSALAPEERNRRLEAWTWEPAAAPFDLEGEPLYRFALARLSSTEHRLLLVLHHLITDGPSLADFLRQSFAAYAARLRGDASPLPEIPFQYTDFAQWQQGLVAAHLTGPQRAYWRRQLTRALPTFELPTDRPRPAIPRFAARRVELRLPPQRLDALMRSDVAGSLFCRVLAALQLLFHRLTGSDDIAVALPISIRSPELAEVLGMFAHTWPLRTRFGARESFGELVPRVDQTLGEMVHHAHDSFHELLAELRVERDASRPLTPITVTQSQPFASESEEISASSLGLYYPEILSDLEVMVAQGFEELRIVVFYNLELFDRVTIERLTDSFDTLLEDVAARPGARLAELGILSPSQRRQVIVDYNRNAAPIPRPHFVHQLFAQRAAERPEAVAAVCGDQEISYRELGARADGIARWLRAQGVGAEDRVAVFGERGLGMLATILGTFQAGAAYVPLDPRHPDERLLRILTAAAPRAVTFSASLAERARKLAAGEELRLLCWDDPVAEPAGDPGLIAAPAGGPGNELAYVFYTSGSTGEPKGAVVEHAGMLNHITAKIEVLGLDPTSVVAQNASHCFDISVWQFLAPMVVGARVVIFPDEVALDPQQTLAAMERDGVTVLETVPSFLSAMFDMPELDLGGGRRPTLPRLTHLVSNAETLPIALARRWFEHFPHTLLVNTFGATETADDTAHYPMPEPPGEDAPRVPVGTPIAGVEHYILDAELRAVPPGFAGQLTLAGVCIGRGYWGNPRLTAQTFVPSAFSAAPGSRLYLTGDLARWHGDGVLDYLSRRDHQVKIRGFRVELGEIEAVLYRHPGVSEAAVVICEAPAGPRPVAYVSPREVGLTIAELRAHLRDQLPEYMVPAAFELLPLLPRTVTGKIDRKALGQRTFPVPEAGRASGEGAARTPTEKVLAEIWAGVLGLEGVGIHDGFFDLGGDSIMSIRVVSLAQQRGIHLTARDFYQYQTIAELAAAVDSRTDGGGGEPRVAAGEVPLTPIQHGLFEKDLVAPEHWNVALMVTLTERMDPRRMEEALRRVTAHHDTFRLRFANGQSGWRALTAAADLPDFFHRFDLSRLPSSRQRTVLESVAAELQRSLDLTAGPLLRVALFDRGPGTRPRCLFVFHHLIMDPVSIEIVLGDFVAAYRGLELPAKTTSFQRWAGLLAAHARSEALRGELRWWLERLPRRISPLPVDLDGEVVDESSTDVVTVALSVAETARLLRALPAVYGTQINEALLAALVEALAGWTGERTMLVALAGHGREEIFDGVDLSRTVGWFNTEVPVWLDLRSASTPGEALRAVRDQLAAIPGRGLGYGLLRYLSDDPRIREQLAARPQPPILFEYLSQTDRIGADGWPFRLAPESVGPRLSRRREPRREPCLLLVKATVQGGRLEVEWHYGTRVHHRATIEGLAAGYLEALRAVLSTCPAPQPDAGEGAHAAPGGDHAPSP